ncbi:hypothetical protein QFC19_000108 [Naganishia cerealis]|uniref:Uncharacterized protein n=1 Tax=Naganishia cerealis TaxID=610337 RepID=A0ACC2WRU1_9TREE|nr:hypothetical protein QFC19_000108 [Naganishia cerealis]
MQRDAEDPTIKMTMTTLSRAVDDGNGDSIISVSKALSYNLVDRPYHGSIPISCDTKYGTGQRYMTHAERKQRETQQQKRKVKRHIYPDVNIGDIVRIRGKLKEWHRKNGDVFREVVMVPNENSITITTAWEEYRHLKEVEQLRRDVYSIPFDPKVYESILVPVLPNSSQVSPTQSSMLSESLAWPATGMSSQATVYDPSDDSTVFSSSASQPSTYLRHPCKLSREQLNDHLFRRYLMEYLRIQTENHWCTDLESAQAIREAARYMPELTWPTPEIAGAQSERARQKQRQAQMLSLDDDLEDINSTPKVSGTRKSMLQYGTKRRSPLTPVKFNGTRVDTFDTDNSLIMSEGASNCAFGLEHLVHVPHLRLIAYRIVRQQQTVENDLYLTHRKAQKAAEKAGLATSGATKQKRTGFGSEYKDSRARHAERGRKMRKAIQHCFRLMVAVDGTAVEVDMSEQDKEAIRADAMARKARTGGLQSFEASYTSNGSLIGNGSFADTTFGNTSQVSIANSSFDYSIWEAPANFKDHPSDSDSSSERTPETRTALRFKDDPTGYLPLTLPVLGMAILHILHEEAFQRSRVYIPNSDWRKSNGLPPSEIWARLKRLHQRWERCQLAVIEDGVEDLEEAKYVKRFGEGWWPVHSRLATLGL